LAQSARLAPAATTTSSNPNSSLSMRGSAALAALLLFVAGTAGAQGDARRGEYVAKAGGCVGCHTAKADGAAPYGGGRALKTPFGTFYGPNITPHPVAGIGRWSETDFVRAMRHGTRRDGANYFPAFPYPSFTRMSDADLRDLWAYLRGVPQSSAASRAHELGWLYRWRFLVSLWKWLYFTPGPRALDSTRGAYLANALGHCGECHTPRNFLGAPKAALQFAGTKQGPEGKRVPNLTPARLKKWDDGELSEFLASGMTPDGNVAGEAMAEVVRNTTSQLTPADLAALVAYLRTLPSIAEQR
jgi:mono/diheme cytochrome c family protein